MGGFNKIFVRVLSIAAVGQRFLTDLKTRLMLVGI
jgi:hypothetical protein